MKFEVSHKDRSVIIALGNQIKRETNKDVPSTLVAADEQFYEQASREDLVAFAKMAAAHALEGEKANEVLRTKLGLIISLLDGSADGARTSALMYSLIETTKLYGLNARNYLAYVFMRGAASHSWEIPAEELEPLMPWNIKEGDLGIVTDEYDWHIDNMVATDEWEASHTAKIDGSA